MLNIKRTIEVNQTSWAELKEASEAGKPAYFCTFACTLPKAGYYKR